MANYYLDKRFLVTGKNSHIGLDNFLNLTSLINTQITANALTFENGLGQTGSTVTLGGTLTTNTTIDGASTYSLEATDLTGLSLTAPSNYTAISDGEVSLNDVSTIAASSYPIWVLDNSGGAVTVKSLASKSVSLNSGSAISNTVFNASINNSVALGGAGITVQQNNSAYANQVVLQNQADTFDGTLKADTLTDNRGWSFQDGSGDIVPTRVIQAALDITATTGEVILFTAASPGLTVELPDSTAQDNWKVIVKNLAVSTQNLTVAPLAGVLDDGATLLPGEVATYVSQGGNWWMISKS